MKSTNIKLSKSRKGSYDACPYGFKLSYVDKIPQPSNIYFIRGIAVHSFHDDFFKNVKINGTKLTIGKELELGDKYLDYKNNIIKHYSNKWLNCVAAKKERAHEYFMPVSSEQKVNYDGDLIEGVNLTGIVDVIDRDYDDELVVVEVKTGKPSMEKCLTYYNDCVWYKLLMEPVLGKLNRGRLYFPYNNYEYKHTLKEEDVEVLKKGIVETAAKISDKKFEPTPSKDKCGWCGYKSSCEFSVVKE